MYKCPGVVACERCPSADYFPFIYLNLTYLSSWKRLKYDFLMGLFLISGFKKQNSILGSLIRLYSVSPSEVVAVLLEFPMKVFDSLDDSIEVVNCSGDPQPETNSSDSKPCLCTVDDWKAIITRLAHKEPALLLTMLEQVLEMIETREAMRFEIGNHLHF